MADAQELYQQALKAIDSGNTSKGQELLRQSLALDAYNLDGWIKMAEIMPDDELKYEILEQILQLDPDNDFANSEWDRLNDLAESGGLGGKNAPPLASSDISSLMGDDDDFDSLKALDDDAPQAKPQRRKTPSVDMSKVKLPEIAALGSFSLDDERIPGISNRELAYVGGGLLFFTMFMCFLTLAIINGARGNAAQSQAQETQRYLALTQTLDAGGTAIAGNFMTQTQIAFDLTSTVNAIISPTPTELGNLIRATEIPPSPTATETPITASRVFPAPPPDELRGDILAWGGLNPSSTRYLSLYHVNPRSTELTTMNSQMVTSPSVNSVGSRVIYMRYESSNNSALMDMIAANNPLGEAEVISYSFDEITEITSPSIASTGSFVVFVGVSPETGRREVYIWDFINQQVTQLTNDGANYQSAAVSPLGNKIVAVREVSGGVDLLLLDRDNAPQGQPALPIVLTMDRGEVLEGDVDFATDGSRILFSATTNGNSDIMVMDMTTNAISPMITSAANEILPHFSPDNRYIVYSAKAHLTCLFWIPSPCRRIN
jgi:hypothetical protein